MTEYNNSYNRGSGGQEEVGSYQQSYQITTSSMAAPAPGMAQGMSVMINPMTGQPQRHQTGQPQYVQQPGQSRQQPRQNNQPNVRGMPMQNPSMHMYVQNAPPIIMANPAANDFQYRNAGMQYPQPQLQPQGFQMAAQPQTFYQPTPALYIAQNANMAQYPIQQQPQRPVQPTPMVPQPPQPPRERKIITIMTPDGTDVTDDIMRHKSLHTQIDGTVVNVPSNDPALQTNIAAQFAAQVAATLHIPNRSDVKSTHDESVKLSENHAEAVELTPIETPENTPGTETNMNVEVTSAEVHVDNPTVEQQETTVERPEEEPEVTMQEKSAVVEDDMIQKAESELPQEHLPEVVTEVVPEPSTDQENKDEEDDGKNKSRKKAGKKNPQPAQAEKVDTKVIEPEPLLPTPDSTQNEELPTETGTVEASQAPSEPKVVLDNDSQPCDKNDNISCDKNDNDIAVNTPALTTQNEPTAPTPAETASPTDNVVIESKETCNHNASSDNESDSTGGNPAGSTGGNPADSTGENPADSTGENPVDSTGENPVDSTGVNPTTNGIDVVEQNHIDSVEASLPAQDSTTVIDVEKMNGETSEESSSDNPAVNTNKMELKYTYREDQWSPANLSGKKVYDRDFLMQFASDSNTDLKIGEQFPDLKRTAEGPDMRNMPAPTMNMNFFMPHYVRSPSGRGMGGGRRSDSRGSRRQSNPPPVKVISIPREKVELHQSENKWKSVSKVAEEKDPNEAETLRLFSSTRSILNKLTPQKFENLKDQLLAQNIDTEEKMKGVVDIIFTTAIDEPAFAKTYAELCGCMSGAFLHKPNVSSFRAILLKRCQYQFEDSKVAEEQCVEKWKKRIEEEKVADEKTKLEMEKEYEMSKLRRRFLGNIRFIGELFQIKLLTEKIIMMCIQSLLVADNEEKLESLCKLLTTTGKFIEAQKDPKPRGGAQLDGVFKQIAAIIDARKVSNRVRFMLQDVVVLRRDRWRPRKEDNNPKTIDQIHKDIQQEDMERAAMASTMTLQPRKQSRGGSMGRGGGGSSGGGSGMSDDGWQSVQTRSKQNQLDPTKTRFSAKPRFDEPISLQPPTARAWGRGSSGGGKSSSQEKPPGNRFTPLTGMKETQDARGGRFRDDRDGSAPRGWGNPYNRGGMHRSMEQDKEAALATARNFNSRTTPRGTPTSSRNASRESSRNRGNTRTASMEKEARDAAAMPAPPVPAAKRELTSEQLEKKTVSIIEEYVQVCDLKEALLCVSEVKSPKTNYKLVFNACNYMVEHKDTIRSKVNELLFHCVKAGHVTKEEFLKGVAEIVEFGEDIEPDIPKFWEYMGQFVAPLVSDQLLSLQEVKDIAMTPLLATKSRSAIFMAEILKALAKKDEDRAGNMWRASEIKWTDLLSDSVAIDGFINKHKLDFTTSMSIEAMSKAILSQLRQANCTHQQLLDWIQANIPKEITSHTKFIRALITAVCRNAIMHGTNAIKVDIEKVKEYCDILNKFLDHKEILELQALFALQALTTELDHPSGFLETLFETLIDNDVISEDAFFKWEADKTEIVGKAVASQSVTRFLISLKEVQ